MAVGTWVVLISFSNSFLAFKIMRVHDLAL